VIGPGIACLGPAPHNRLLKTAHLRGPILRMGTRRVALHLDRFEQPGQELDFPVSG